VTPTRAAAFLCLLALAGCGGAAVDEDSGPTGAPAAADPSPAATEEAAPPAAEPDEESRAEAAPLPSEDTTRPVAEIIEGETLDGGFVSLADFRGRPVFVKFFAFH
jgi:hypothetical protein